MSHLPQSLSTADELCLIRAFEHLEYPSFAARLSSLVGTPIETAVKLLPRQWRFGIQRCAESAIGRALDVAISDVNRRFHSHPGDGRYRLLGMASGAIGGFFGGPALLLEIPVTTMFMLSSIAEIARGQGEDLESLEARLACLQVFALGGRSDADNAADTGYYGLRMALELPIARASGFLAREGIAVRGNTPVLVSLISTLAERFGVVLSQKAMAEIIPLIGAVGGAFINGAFIRHFEDMARSHFAIRRLERKYSREFVKAAYQRIKLKRLPSYYNDRGVIPANRRIPKIGTVSA